MKNKRWSLSKTSKFFIQALLVLYCIVLTRVTYSSGGLAEYRESRIKRNPVLDQRTKTRENREVYKDRFQSGYPDTTGYPGTSGYPGTFVYPDTGMLHEVVTKSPKSRSATVGSVHHSGANKQAPQDSRAY